MSDRLPEGLGSDFFARLSRDVHAYAIENSVEAISVDIWLLVYLRQLSRFGYFTLGPVTIDVELIERIVESTLVKSSPPLSGPPPMGDDVVRFFDLLMSEVRRSGRRRIDELHMVLALMRVEEGLPRRVFSELGVTPEQVEEYVRHPQQAQGLEKLYSPEEAAAYLNVHVQTVRTWIRTGRLRARRLAGQRALRITASDLQSVLEPLEPGQEDDAAG